MAKFKLFLLSLTNTKENIVSFTPSIISEFYSPDVVKQYENNENILDTQYSSYCYTFNENLSIHSNAQKDLTFKMEKMILKDDE
ncbi:MAG: hypothetical protein K5765_01110 [Clostridia bacterium]|nr:hypothetical protein [Clostridia bacterium]